MTPPEIELSETRIAALNFGALEVQKTACDDGDPDGYMREYVLALLQIQQEEIVRRRSITQSEAAQLPKP